MVVVYCICDEVTKMLNIKDDVQCRMSAAEIMTFALMSAMVYQYNYRVTRLVTTTHRYFSKILSHSQMVRRIDRIPEVVWTMVWGALRLLLRSDKNGFFIVDSFPVKSYENHKSFRVKIFQGAKYV